jgi:hypothetical protein
MVVWIASTDHVRDRRDRGLAEIMEIGDRSWYGE